MYNTHGEDCDCQHGGICNENNICNCAGTGYHGSNCELDDCADCNIISGAHCIWKFEIICLSRLTLILSQIFQAM